MKEILKKYGIKPSKRLGQNFLTDKSVLKKIIEAAGLSANDVVLEIGPGLGILTIELAKKVKPARHCKQGVAGGKIIAIEKDKKMCEILKELLDVRNVQNVRIVNEDILKIPNDKIQMPNEIQRSNYKLIANLPYYITSPVIRKFLETKNKPKLMILMVQKEVAQRICAKPGKMSLLSVAVQFYAKPEIISYVSKKSFYPQPRVDSAIIKIKPRNKTELSKTDAEKFFKLVKKGFSAKRKMLKNNLKISQKILEKIGLNPKIRAEELSINDWLNLFYSLTNKKML